MRVASAASTQLAGQAGAGQAGTPAAPAARGGRGGGIPQGGRGPIKVMVVTKGHTYDREPFFQMWDSWGSDITWSHVEHPAADVMLSPKYSKLFDVYAFFDIGGAGLGGRSGPPPNLPPGTFKTANDRYYPPPSEQLKTEFPKLLREGKGFVFLHHASAAWVHTWPEYSEVVGGACDWYSPNRVRGIDNPNHGYFGMTPQFTSFVDKNHPSRAGSATASMWSTRRTPAIGSRTRCSRVRAQTSCRRIPRRISIQGEYSTGGVVKTAENSPVFFTTQVATVSPPGHPGLPSVRPSGIKWAHRPRRLRGESESQRIFTSSN